MKHTSIHDSKMWHFYVVLIGWATIYTTMNISVVLFLHEILGSIFLAGLALAIGSIFSLLFDGLFSAFQKVFVSRTLFLTSILGMILAVFLFLVGQGAFIAFVAAIFFRVAFDLCDITATNYVLARSQPKNYGQNLSYKQFSQGIGMILGLAVSAILMSAAYFVGEITSTVIDETAKVVSLEIQSEEFLTTLFIMKIFLLAFLAALWIFAYMLFDKEVERISKKEILQTIGSVKREMLETISFRKHREKEKKERIDFGKIFLDFTDSIKTFFLIFRKKPIDAPLVWSLGVMAFFSYWDTFLATFMPIFFTEVLREQEGWLQHIPGSLLMLIFILPILALLPFVAKLGDKIGREFFMITGIVLTALFSFVIGIVSTEAFFILFLAGFGIGLGYLFGMSSAKAQAAFKMNAFVAKTNPKKNSDNSDASAGHIMLVDNVGNIIGPMLGGFLIQFLEFRGFFLLFAFLLMTLFGFTVWKKRILLGKK